MKTFLLYTLFVLFATYSLQYVPWSNLRACKTKSDCSAHFKCANKKCVRDFVYCGRGQKCPNADEYCHDDQCLLNSRKCKSNAECGVSQMCYQGQCNWFD